MRRGMWYIYDIPARCPLCDSAMIGLMDRDSVVCPRHGHISWLTMLVVQGMPKWEAQLEVAAEQLKGEIHQLCVSATSDLTDQLSLYGVRT